MNKKVDEPKYYIFKMDAVTLQITSTILLVVMVIFTISIDVDLSIYNKDFAIAFIFMIPYLILHELLHSLSYVIHGADFKNITNGAHLEKGILCCLCKQNISKKNILISLLYPFLFIGIVTYVIGIITNDVPLIFLSIFNISGCSGDLTMFLGLSRIKNFEYSEFDDPMAFGIYTKENLKNKKMFGLKYVETKDELEKSDFKKVNISKISIVVTIGLILLGIINLLIL